MAAGRGSRMRPLTDTIPKPLINVVDQPILDHIAAALPSEITEIILVINYKAEQIKAHCGMEYFGRPVTYVEQEDSAGGTGAALRCAAPHITGTFLVVNGDDIYGKVGLTNIVKEAHAMLYHTSDHPEDFGVISATEDHYLIAIQEKPPHPQTDMVNIGGFVLSPAIFNYQTDIHTNGEVYLTDMVTDYTKKYPIKLIEQELWLPIGRPQDIPVAEAKLRA